jgi:hypothetical protein
METIKKKIVIFMRMDCKGDDGIKCESITLFGIAPRNKCTRDGMVMSMEMRRLMMRVMLRCPPMTREAARICPHPTSSSGSLPGVVFRG